MDLTCCQGTSGWARCRNVGWRPSARTSGTAPGAGSAPSSATAAPPDSAARDVLDLLLPGRDERHHVAELGPDLLDRVVEPGLTDGLVVGWAVCVLLHPLLGERAVLDLGQDPGHLGADRLVDHPRSPGEVAVLGGVGDGEPHPADPLLVHQVDDQLELVEAFEVGRFGLIAGADQGLVPGLD